MICKACQTRLKCIRTIAEEQQVKRQYRCGSCSGKSETIELDIFNYIAVIDEFTLKATNAIVLKDTIENKYNELKNTIKKMMNLAKD